MCTCVYSLSAQARRIVRSEAFGSTVRSFLTSGSRSVWLALHFTQGSTARRRASRWSWAGTAGSPSGEAKGEQDAGRAVPINRQGPSAPNLASERQRNRRLQEQGRSGAGEAVRADGELEGDHGQLVRRRDEAQVHELVLVAGRGADLGEQRRHLCQYLAERLTHLANLRGLLLGRHRHPSGDVAEALEAVQQVTVLEGDVHGDWPVGAAQRQVRRQR